MKVRLFVTVAAAALFSAGAFLADPPVAEAQSSGVSKSQRSKSKSRIVVRKRSYLDAGTDVLPGDRKFNDYVYPPGYNALDVLGPGQNFWRNPMNNPWDIPGAPKY